MIRLLLLNNDSGSKYPDNLIAIYTTTNPDEEHTFTLNNGDIYPYEKNVDVLGDGTYRVEIYSDENFSSFSCNTNTLTVEYLKVTKNVTDMSRMFYECNSLTSIDVSNFDTSNVTAMTRMFYECNSLTSIDVSNFDTSNVTDMYYMFYDCANLKHVNLSNFDLAKVTYGNIFGRCKSLLEIEMYNCSTNTISEIISYSDLPKSTDGSVHTMYVDSAEAVKGLTAPKGWKFVYKGSDETITFLQFEDKYNVYLNNKTTRNIKFTYEPSNAVLSTLVASYKHYSGDGSVINIIGINTEESCVVVEGITAGSGRLILEDTQTGISCEITINVNDIAVAKFYTNNDASSTFSFTFNYEDVTESDCSFVDGLWSYESTNDSYNYNFSNMYELSRINELKVTSDINDMSWMFSNCSSLYSIDNMTDWDITNVNNMESMFEGCSAITSVDFSSSSPYNISNMINMFNGCSNLTYLYINNWDLSYATLDGIFNDCYCLSEIYCDNANSINILAQYLPSSNGTLYTTCQDWEIDVSSIKSMGWTISYQ